MVARSCLRSPLLNSGRTGKLCTFRHLQAADIKYSQKSEHDTFVRRLNENETQFEGGECAHFFVSFLCFGMTKATLCLVVTLAAYASAVPAVVTQLEADLTLGKKCVDTADVSSGPIQPAISIIAFSPLLFSGLHLPLSRLKSKPRLTDQPRADRRGTFLTHELLLLDLQLWILLLRKHSEEHLFI